ncbi:hypothetical protein ACFOSV_03715 [Algoriphagus namhaensis]|uniref:DUF306 domain-containing protein n=1 Tax=Algoriphagus namhaensis TaxID=915353 RepID=A0ABV8ANS6_9BACT
MKKLKSYFALGTLLLLLNSCVYSLFPIYTEETLVFLPELLGRWQLTGEQEDYIEFQRINSESEENIQVSDPVNESSNEVYTDSITVNGMTLRFNTDDGMMVEGKMVYDRDSIRMFYERIAQRVDFSDDSENSKSTMEAVGESLDALGKSIDAIGKSLDAVTKAGGKVTSFEGSMYESNDESYRIIVMDDGERTEYMGHVAKIGKDHFLDIYPLAEYSDSGFGSNMMPVHTFMKLELKRGQLDMTQFDLDKLNRLFESNLIRLRHENVDGTVLITAQPEEIQKFLDRYSDDESVFEETDTYQKID